MLLITDDEDDDWELLELRLLELSLLDELDWLLDALLDWLDFDELLRLDGLLDELLVDMLDRLDIEDLLEDELDWLLTEMELTDELLDD